MMAVLTATGFGISYADKSSSDHKPYGAETDEECIMEKACIWHALKHMILAQDISGKDNGHSEASRKIASRWNKPVNIKLIGKQRNQFRITLDSAIKTLDDFVPFEISYDTPFNFLVFFSEDMEADLSTTYRQNFQEMTGDDRVYNYFLKTKESSSSNCFFIRFNEDNITKAHFVFVDITDSPNYCLMQNLYAGLANRGHLQSFEFSGLRETTADKPQYTLTDMFLLQLYYKLNISKNDTYMNLQKKFLLIYQDELEKFLKLKK